MITFKRLDTKAVASVDVVIPYYNERCFPLSFDCGNEAYAGLLTRAMTTSMWEKLKEIRRLAYEQGWKDAKAKKPKETWFKEWW